MAEKRAGESWTVEEHTELAKGVVEFVVKSMAKHQRSMGSITTRISLVINQYHPELRKLKRSLENRSDNLKE